MSTKTTLEENINAIKLAKLILEKDKKSTPEEIEILKKFKGFGGIKAILFPLDIEWKNIDKISSQDLKLEKEIKEFHQYIFDSFEDPTKIWNGIKESTLTSFYTPNFVAFEQVKKIYENNNNNIKNILDPCAGNGIYIEAFLNFFKDAKITGVEIEQISALILKAIYNKNENVRIINKAFEDVKFNEKFDLISSNIPFGNFKINYKEYNSKITDKIHNFFFYHSSRLLNTGGALSFLTSTGVFNSSSNQQFRDLLSENLEIKSILTLPKNTFKDAGTEVTSHIISAVQNINAKEKKFVNTIKDDNNIEINNLIKENFESAFLISPIISTNPYGTNEYNYTLDIDSFKVKLKEKLYSFEALNLERENNVEEKKISFKKNSEFIDDFFYFNNKLELLDDSSFIDNKNKESFETLGLVTVNYKGNVYPVATFGKVFSEEENKKKYILEYHLENFNSPKKELLAKEFKVEFEKFTKNLEDLSKTFSLAVDIVYNKDYNDSKEFSNYFKERFNQPILDLYFQTNFSNFSFHKEISEGMLVLNSDNVPCKINRVLNEDDRLIYELESIKGREEDKLMLFDYLQLYDSYNLYIKLKNDDNLSGKYLKRLNNCYDTFVNNYGSINENKNIHLYDNNYINILKALENYDENAVIEDSGIDLFSYQEKRGKWIKSDIFFEKQKETEIENSNLALAKCFNEKGKIEIEYISSLTKKSIENLLEELNDKIIFNPFSKEYEFKNLFLSGDILKKINEIKSISLPGENEEILNLLESVLPVKIPFEAINIQFGSRWLPQNIINEFAKRYFEQEFNMVFNENLDNFFVNPKGNLSNKYSSFNYCCINGRYVYPEQIIQNAFYDTYPVVTYSVDIDGQKVTYNDDEATKYFKREISNFRKDFLTYLYNLNQEQKELITKIYNDKFNSIVIPKYDTDILDFSVFNLKALGINEIYDHQKRAVWKSINNEGGVVDHEVGLGKTFTIIASAYFGKKLGVYNKPIILGIKANVPVLAETYKNILPESNILFASSKEFTKKEREIFLNKIRNNNYDAVIMSHEQFSKIDQDINIEKDVIGRELEDVEDNLFNAKNADISKQQLKGLEIRKKNLSARLDNVLTRIKKRKDENVLNFSDLGVDHIIIDESHKYKNLMFQTKHTRVAGLGNTEGSQRATNLLLAIRHIQKNTRTGDYGSTFFSGTPISNSLTELYLLQKYLTPNVLKEKNIYNFDAWCSNFAEKSIDFETNMVNKIITKERFRYFTNLPELSLMYNQMADIMTGDMAKIDRPEKNEFLLLNEQTPLQKRFYVKLNKFLNTKDQSVLGLDKPLSIDSQSTALSLVAINLAFKASLDMRLISTKYQDEEDSKVNNVVSELLRRYNKFDDQKMAQIVFLDISTPKKKLTFEELENNYDNNLFTSLYDDIKFKLIKNGIPENEIAFVQHYETERKKLSLSQKMNKGEIRILIGATENAGTGLNIQERLGFINHFSIPWKPSELEQRNGRGFRTGNWFAKNFNDNKIDIGISATKNTLDNYKIDLNKNKQNFISQLKGASIGLQVARKIDEGSMDENSGMSLAELQAQLTGDNSLLLKHKNDNKIKELEQEKMFILTKKSETEQKIQLAEKKIRQFENIKELFSRDLNEYNANVKFDDKGNRINKPSYIGLIDDPTNEQIINHLKNVVEKAKDYDSYTQKKVAELYGFDLVVTNDLWDGVKFFIRNTKYDDAVTYSLNKGKINLESDSAAISYFIRSLDLIENKLNNTNKNIKEEQNNIEILKLNLNYSFDKEEDLLNLIKEGERLEEKIKNSNLDSMDIYPTKIIRIDEEDVSFKIINNLKHLDIAILNEHLGGEYTEQGIFCSDDIREFILELSKKDNCGFQILNQNIDLTTKEHFIKYEVYDYDKMYVNFDKVKKEIDYLCVETFLHYKEFNEETLTIVHNYFNDKDYSYADDAISIAKILNKEYKIIKDMPMIKLSKEDVNEIIAKEKENDWKIEIFEKLDFDDLDNDFNLKI